MNIIINSINYDTTNAIRSNTMMFLISIKTRINAFVVFDNNFSIKGDFIFNCKIDSCKEAEEKIREYFQ